MDPVVLLTAEEQPTVMERSTVDKQVPVVPQTAEEQLTVNQQKGDESDLGSDFESDFETDFESDFNPKIEKLKKETAEIEQNKKDMETANKYFDVVGILQLYQQLQTAKTKENRDKIFEAFLKKLHEGTILPLFYYLN